MLRRVVIFSFLFAFMILLNGCASGRRQSDMEIQSLRNQVSLLESQAQSKEEELSNLRGALNRTEAQKEAIVEPWTRPKAKNIQAALLNAGYNPGVIDGKIGRQTKEAIRAFQKANNLAVDGKIGKKTWELLRGYLEKKVK